MSLNSILLNGLLFEVIFCVTDDDDANVTSPEPCVKISEFVQSPSRYIFLPLASNVPPVIVIVPEAFNWSERDIVIAFPLSSNTKLLNGYEPEVILIVEVVVVEKVTVFP